MSCAESNTKPRGCLKVPGAPFAAPQLCRNLPAVLNFSILLLPRVGDVESLTNQSDAAGVI
jgi:hypothetical protein